MKKAFLSLILSTLIFLAMGSVAVFAEQAGGGSAGGGSGGNPSAPVNNSFTIPNPFKDSVGGSLNQLIRNIMNDIVLPIGGVLCVLAFIYAGFLYVTAQGNETQITKANTALLYAAIGTAILLGSWVLATAICETIGALGGPSCDF